jgi:hypothetical protein
MLTKEKEAMVRAARNLHGSMLIDRIKAWKRGELKDDGVILATQLAVKNVADVAKSLEPVAQAPLELAKPQEKAKP